MAQSTIPILERITQDIIDACRLVTVQAGYTCDLIVERPDPIDGNPARDCLAVVIQANPTRQTDGIPAVHAAWSQPYQIVVARIRSDDEETGMDVHLSRVLGDVCRAVTRDITRGGLAEDTWIDSPEFDYAAPSSNSGFVTVNVTVWYRTYFNDPFRSIHEA